MPLSDNLSTLSQIYSQHHERHGRLGFSVLADNRGKLFCESIGKDKQILDLGCRDGVLTKYFYAGNSVLGLDIDPRALALARERLNIKTKLFDVNDDWSDLGSEKFDVVVAGEILEHLYFPERTIAKVSAVLTKGGLFIGSVPNAFSWQNRLRLLLGHKRNTPLGDPTHINHFLCGELKGMLNRYFCDIKIIGLGRLGYLARLFPGPFAFDLVFLAQNKKE